MLHQCVSEGVIICKLMRFSVASERQQSIGCWCVHGCVSNGTPIRLPHLCGNVRGGAGGVGGWGAVGVLSVESVDSTETRLVPKITYRKLLEVGNANCSHQKHHLVDSCIPKKA